MLSLLNDRASGRQTLHPSRLCSQGNVMADEKNVRDRCDSAPAWPDCVVELRIVVLEIDVLLEQFLRNRLIDAVDK